MTDTSLPKIVIVGRPNVGKSSLFNRIVGSRKAIVESARGTTRDRLYATITRNGKAFTIIDTGGFEKTKRGDIAELVVAQLQAAIKEADTILFVTDAAVGVTPQDAELASRLRKTSKKIYLIVNKADDASRVERASDFFELGLGEPYAISAMNGRGIDDLINDLVKGLEGSGAILEKKPVGVAIVGRPNVGKSSYLNAILGEERVIVHPVAGTTRDAVDIHFNYKDRDYLLIDTAGMRHNPKIKEPVDFFGTVRSKEAVKRSDVAVVLIDGLDGLREDDARIIDLVMREGKALVVAVNKSDLINNEARQAYNELLVKKMNAIKDLPVIFTSCKTGKNVTASLDLVWSVYERSKAILRLDELKEILESLRNAAEIRNKRVTVLFLKQEGAMPPRFAIGIRGSHELNDNLKRYIENFLKNACDFKGVPVRIRFENKPKGGAVARNKER